jgi:hypothetical protein
MTVDRIVADDTSAVVQWHAAGTFTGGPFQNIVPTGRRVDLRGADVMEIADGLVQHNTIYYDGATFARQIGLLPALGSRADQAMLAAFNAKTTLSQRPVTGGGGGRPGPGSRRDTRMCTRGRGSYRRNCADREPTAGAARRSSRRK